VQAWFIVRGGVSVLLPKSRSLIILAILTFTVLSTILAYTVFSKETILTPKSSSASYVTFPSPHPISFSSVTPQMGDSVLDYVRNFLAIRVDKKVYKVGEVVKITIINQGNMLVGLADPPWAIYKKLKNGKWVKIYEPPYKLRNGKFFDIKRGNMINVTIPEIIVIEPHGEYSWIWDMRAYGELVEPGTYAVSLLRSNLSVRVGGRELRIVRAGMLLVEGFSEPTTYFIVEQ